MMMMMMMMMMMFGSGWVGSSTKTVAFLAQVLTETAQRYESEKVQSEVRWTRGDFLTATTAMGQWGNLARQPTKMLEKMGIWEVCFLENVYFNCFLCFFLGRKILRFRDVDGLEI